MAVEEIVEATEEYWTFILKLRNDLKEGFITQGRISVHQHYEFMMRHGSCYWVQLLDDTPVGFVGVIKGDIRYAVDPAYQGRGYGTKLLEWAHSKFPYAKGLIKSENVGSIKAFEKAGFKKKFVIMERYED